MKVNISKFESVIKRATVDSCIDYLHMVVTKQTIKAKLIGTERNVISILNLLNDGVFIWEDKDKLDEFVLDFDLPDANVMPYLEAIEDEEATFTFKKEAVELTTGGTKTKLCLAYPQEAKIFAPDAPRAIAAPFAEVRINDEVRLAFVKVKKVSKASKFYIVSEGGSIFFEAGDRSNPGSNEVRTEVTTIADDGSRVIQVPFKIFSSIMTLIGRSDKFTMHLCYLAEKATGMIGFVSEDGTEKYYLLGKQD